MKPVRTVLTYFIICILLFGVFSPLIQVSSTTNQNTIENTQNTCYAYIIPLPPSNIIEKNPKIHTATINLINDLLAQNIVVYWVNTTMNVLVKNNSNAPAIHLPIEPGTFIIPFTENKTKNNIINVIITDYTINHELEKNCTQTEAYLLLEPITIQSALQLNEPKIAQYYGPGVIEQSMDWYINNLTQSGFLNYELLKDSDIISNLNDAHYSVILWPGGQYDDDLKSNTSLETRYLRQYKIKKFVSSGGGFVGSCYAAYVVSKGFKHLSFSLFNQQFPRLSSLNLFQGLQDSYIGFAIPSYFNVSIDENPHPVLFGTKKTINKSVFRGGCVFSKLGENTRSLATVKEIDVYDWLDEIRDSDELKYRFLVKILDNWISYTTGKTVWTTSTYGKGKMVTFGDHPEKGNIHLQRVTHNALFYVNSEQKNMVGVNTAYSLDDLFMIRKSTKNLSLTNNQSDFFTDAKQQLRFLNQSIHEVEQKIYEYHDILMQFRNQGIIEWDFCNDLIFSFYDGYSETFDRYLLFFSPDQKEKTIASNLLNMERILFLLEKHDFPIHPEIKPFSSTFSKALSKMNRTTSIISNDLSRLIFEIKQYQHSKDQDDLLVELHDQVIFKSKDIEKHGPNVYSQSTRMLRDLWYYYERSLV